MSDTDPSTDETLTNLDSLLMTPQKIGHFRILQRIGEGGMGVVYLAEQEEPIRRRVALKLIKMGMDTEQVIARFESERQALALMNHPNIARVFDAGSTEQGRPYFVMEYIQGVPITDYCDTNRLNTGERLDLFLEICDGIQHAHQKGIIHRDIKSSNVLVTFQDERPVSKIIDFGVAKATAQRLTERTYFTEQGQLIGTPEFMSPEQAEMTGLDIDTRTDVYSLGVLLYELIVGVLPFDFQKLRQGGWERIRKTIRETEPQKPSTRITTLGESSKEVAKRHGADLPTLRRQLKGDLDWIVMKAVEKDRTRRYASASELAADITRHLTHHPVMAGPPSNWYRMRKLVRRHKAAVVTASLVILAMLIGLAGTTIGLIRAKKAEQAASEEAETAKQVSDFMIGLFKVSDPTEARGNTVTAREILDRGAEKIERELKGRPLVQARLMDTMGRVYRSLGLFQQAKLLLEKGLEIRRSLLGEDHLEVSDSLSNLASVLWDRGDYSQAKQYFERSLSIKEKALGPNDIQVAAVCHNLANVLWSKGDYATAKLLLERSMAIREKVLGPRHPEVTNTMNSLGALYYAMGDYAKAQSYWERTLAIREEVLGPDHPFLAMTLNNLGTLKKDGGDYVGAKPLLERAIRIQEKSLGSNHPNLAAGLNSLSYLLCAMKDFDAAKPLIQRAIAIEESNFGPDHPEVARFLQNLADIYRETGDYAAARPIYERALTIRRKNLGENHRDTAWSLQGIASLDADEGRYADAERHYLKALQIQKQILGPDHPDVGWTLCGLAELHTKRSRHAEAEQLYVQALANLEKNLGPDHPDVKKTRESLTRTRNKLAALPAKSTN
jgi:serine/threonine protein kinase/tetratricopeptide (TPR) repeat protein